MIIIEVQRIMQGDINLCGLVIVISLLFFK